MAVSATIRDDRSYRIDPTGLGGWRIVSDHGPYVFMRHDTFTFDDPGHPMHGTPATVTVPRSHLILADPARSAGAAGGETEATPQAQRSAPAAESAPRESGDREAPGGTLPAHSSLGAPIARATDPATSHDAASTAKLAAAKNRITVLLAHEAAGADGLTGDELEQATGLDYETVGPRRPWLVDNGFLAFNGVRRPNRKGNAEQVYTITAAGVDMARRLRAEGKAA